MFIGAPAHVSALGDDDFHFARLHFQLRGVRMRVTVARGFG
ncbi:MAG: hypothetical protein OD918_10365 [Gammaproteobacteria bacterium]